VTTTTGYRAAPLERGDTAAMRAWYDVHATAHPHDHPGLSDEPWEEFRERQLEVRDSTRSEVWLLRDTAGDVVGGARLDLPAKDNTDVVAVDLVVHPARRRSGAGTALLDTVRRRAGEHGRTRLLAEIGSPLEGRSPGEEFATRHGAAQALVELRRVLDLDGVDEVRLDRLRAEAGPRAAGYEVIQWTGMAPDDLLDGLALLQARLSADAPLDDLEWEPERWDAARVRESYERSEAVGRLVVSTAVRERATGELAGMTDIGVSRFAPETGFQWSTIVLSGHRGRRLGTVLKVDNLRLLRRESPRTRCLHTWNAASNAHMVAINEAVGFKPVEQWSEWVLPL
jgi:GNAT superfamily N-acetyltransferase